MVQMPKTPQSAANIRKVAQTLAETASTLEALAAMIELEEHGTLGIRNWDQCRRAMDYVDNYAKAVRDALKESRAIRGSYTESPTMSAKPPKSSAKKAAKPRRSGHSRSSADIKDST